MAKNNYERELSVAVDAVRVASVLCRQVQKRIADSVLEKSDRSPVTVADFGSQAVICRQLKEVFPEDEIVAEEASDALKEKKSEKLLERVVSTVRRSHPSAGAHEVCEWIDFGAGDAHTSRHWTLDPIDGTKGFLRGEQYAVALALIVDGEVVVAVLGCPNLSVSDGSEERGVMFAAIQGEGVRAMPLDGTHGPFEVSTSDLSDSTLARFCESVESEHTAHGDSAEVARLLGIAAPSVRLDSQAKYAVVARGDADIYMRLPSRPGYVEKIWDHAAGSLVISEAGGTVTDVFGSPLDFSVGRTLANNKGVIATNGRLHESVIAALESVGVGS